VPASILLAALLLSTVFITYDEWCIGPAFQKNDNSPEVKSGTGRCVSWFLFKNPSDSESAVFASHKSYQGEFVKAKREGHGVYSQWSVFNNRYKHPFEGDDKVTFEGDWKNDQPEGFGAMSFPVGLVYTGQWKGSNITCDVVESGPLCELQLADDGTPKKYSSVFHDFIKYRGRLQDGIMDGIGKVLFVKNVPTRVLTAKAITDQLTATFHGGVMVGVANGTLDDGTKFTVSNIVDTIGVRHDFSCDVAVFVNEEVVTFHWTNDFPLKHNVTAGHPAFKPTKMITAALLSLTHFEMTVSANHPHIQGQQFITFKDTAAVDKETRSLL